MLNHNVTCCNNWQMLLPGGRWNSHYRVFLYTLADGIARRQMDYYSNGRCWCQVADGIATGSDYSSFNSEVLIRTSSHMCGRWYLPMFLLRDGLLTLMNSASFIHLLRFWSSLPTMLKLSMVMFETSDVKMVIYGGCLEMFFEPLSKYFF